MEKKPFPFDPFVDSLIGEKILTLLHNQYTKESLTRLALESLGIGLDQVCFTSNVKKQILMVSYPTEIRKRLESNERIYVCDLLFQIAKGSHENPPALDIALELIEWLLTGFEEDALVSDSLSKIFGIQLDIDFVNLLRSEYVKELRG